MGRMVSQVTGWVNGYAGCCKLLGHLRHPDVTGPIAPVRWAEVPDLAPPYSPMRAPLPRLLFGGSLFFVGELDGLHIAPGVEDLSGVASVVSTVV